MTDPERISRQALLARAAAAAGAAYVAPVLTSSASAEGEACAGQKCKPGKKGRKKCKKAGGKSCKCSLGRCTVVVDNCSNCTRHGCPCSALEACEGCGGNGACFTDATQGGDPCGCGLPGTCVDLRDGLCASFSPCDGTSCPAGQCCFSSCCDCVHVFPLLCSDSCGSGPSKWTGGSVDTSKGPLAFIA
jgi:hypothetical protein